MTIPTDGVNKNADSLGASAAGTVDVDAGDDKKNLLGVMSEFAKTMSEEGDSAEASGQTGGMSGSLIGGSSGPSIKESPDLGPKLMSLQALMQKSGDDGKSTSFSQTDPQGTKVSANARRLDDGGFKADVEMETIHPDGTLASKSTASILETADGKTQAEFTTEAFDETGKMTYMMRKTHIEGEGTTVFEKTLNDDGSYSESTAFTPESA